MSENANLNHYILMTRIRNFLISYQTIKAKPIGDTAYSDLWIRSQWLLNQFLSVYDGVRRVSGLRREPVVSVKNPTLIPAFP